MRQIFSVVSFIFLGRIPQNGGGVGRMLMPSKGKLTASYNSTEVPCYYDFEILLFLSFFC